MGNTPIERSEFRELTVRHMLAEHDNQRARTITENLFSIYAELVLRSSGKALQEELPEDFISDRDGTEIIRYFNRNYCEGFSYGSQPETVPITNSELPLVMPRGLYSYPKDIVEQFAAILGYKTATQS